MPHDLGTWGFIIALVALILAYPLDVLAHITLPIIRDWWAARSIAVLEKRRNVLSSQLDKLHGVPVIDVLSDIVLQSLQRIILAIGQAVNLMIGAIAVTQSNFSFNWNLSEKSIFVLPTAKGIFMIVILGFNAYWTTSLIGDLRKYRRDVSPRIREGIRAEVTKIEKALHKRQQATLQNG